MHDDLLPGGPALEVGREAGVGDEVDVVDPGVANLVQDPVDHRPSAHRQQLLRDRVGERAKASRIARGQDQGDHKPSSVTIAVIRDAGVTSNAGLRAVKRVVTSDGSRSSIGIDAPVGVAGSSVDDGATT